MLYTLLGVFKIMGLPICITCGTNKQDLNTGFCKNDHDNWLEKRDSMNYFREASKNLNKTIDEIYDAIENGTDLSVKK